MSLSRLKSKLVELEVRKTEFQTEFQKAPNSFSVPNWTYAIGHIGSWAMS